jgi:hypothetical protein
MARRAPFPPSSIPAYIEQSMKLFVWSSGFATGSFLSSCCQQEQSRQNMQWG